MCHARDMPKGKFSIPAGKHSYELTPNTTLLTKKY
jgi:hypothetical protein